MAVPGSGGGGEGEGIGGGEGSQRRAVVRSLRAVKLIVEATWALIQQAREEGIHTHTVQLAVAAQRVAQSEERGAIWPLSPVTTKPEATSVLSRSRHGFGGGGGGEGGGGGGDDGVGEGGGEGGALTRRCVIVCDAPVVSVEVYRISLTRCTALLLPSSTMTPGMRPTLGMVRVSVVVVYEALKEMPLRRSVAVSVPMQPGAVRPVSGVDGSTYDHTA